jgi:DNA-binding SARP family transcriptional activator/tetratricopeptide (TPR) repeat protein
MAKGSLDFRLLGPLEVFDDGRDLTPTQPKRRALLALLLIRRNDVVPSDELVAALWGERPPGTAATALHGHVSALRKALGRAAIETRPPGYLLRVAARQTDLGRFEELVDEARGEADPARRAELLARALELFRGEPLADFRYDDFAAPEINRLEELRLSAVADRIDAELELGRHGELVAELERLLAAHPLDERLRGQLMVALYRGGRQADALRVYHDARRVLSVELGLDPGSALRDLERRILTHDADLAAPGEPDRSAAQPVIDRELPPAPSGKPHRERKLVSVLFCDLAGHTARAEQLDPEDLQALLERYFERVRGHLESFGGTLEKFIGDAVMAVFGAPVAHEDDAERAVRAALEIRDALADELELRIAVFTGEALVTVDADPASGQGIVVGDVVNTASRLQAEAPSGSVIVGAATQRATRDAIDYRELEPIVARGKREPVAAWEALRARTARSRRRPGAGLVGRRRELDQLVDALSRARGQRAAQLATIVGVPGIGKTRLVRELRRRAEADREPVGWLLGRSIPYGDGVPLWALGEVVKAQAAILEDDPAEVAEGKLRAAVEDAFGAGAEADWALRHLRPLVGLAGGAPVGERGGEAFGAWRLFLETLADEAPLVLVFEDLHWADEGLLDFVDELTGRVADVPLLVVCTARPELLDRRPAWGGGKPNATAIRLAPLSDEETEQLVAALLEGTVGEAGASVAARAGGIPLYAEEYAQLVLERDGDGDLPLPVSLHALIAARLDRLPGDEKALVQAAAVIGETAWAGAIAAVSGRQRSEVEEHAPDLERKEILSRRRRSAVEGETEFSFRHALLRDVAYSQIPRAERGPKHRLAARWIESLGRAEDHAELVAHHYLRSLELARAGEETAELERRARGALRDAGARAAALGAHRAAARHLAAALELAQSDDPERPDLLLARGRALLHAEVGGERDLLAASAAFADVGDRLGAARAEALLATLFQEEGRGRLARERFATALELVDALPPSPETGEIMAEACRALMMAGDSAEAVRVGEETLAVADALDLEELRTSALISIAPARWSLGDAAGCIRDLERAIEIASSINSDEVVRGYGNLGATLAEMGELARAGEARAEGLRLAERFETRWYLRWLRFDRLEQLYFAGADWDEILRLADEIVDERSFQATTGLWTRAMVRLGRGDRVGAAADAASSLELARESADAQVLMPGLALSGLVETSNGSDETASSRASELLSLIESHGALSAQLVLPLLCVVLRRLDRGDEFAAFSEPRTPTRFWDAASAYAVGDLVGAAETYARIGSRPDEAYARLRAGTELAAGGRHAEATEQLRAALEFHRAVGAVAYVAEAQAALAVCA